MNLTELYEWYLEKKEEGLSIKEIEELLDEIIKQEEENEREDNKDI